jgi:hypothetical protein
VAGRTGPLTLPARRELGALLIPPRRTRTAAPTSHTDAQPASQTKYLWTSARGQRA